MGAKKAAISQLAILTLASAILVGCVSNTSYRALQQKRTDEAYNRLKAELATKLAKSIKFLSTVKKSHLEAFFADIEESQWDHFVEVFHTLDLFLFNGLLETVPTKTSLKRKDTRVPSKLNEPSTEDSAVHAVPEEET